MDSILYMMCIYIYMFMIYLYSTFHMRNSSSLVITIKPKVKYNFYKARILFALYKNIT
jgi:hypothetical protein